MGRLFLISWAIAAMLGFAARRAWRTGRLELFYKGVLPVGMRVGKRGALAVAAVAVGVAAMPVIALGSRGNTAMERIDACRAAQQEAARAWSARADGIEDERGRALAISAAELAIGDPEVAWIAAYEALGLDEEGMVEMSAELTASAQADETCGTIDPAFLANGPR